MCIRWLLGCAGLLGAIFGRRPHLVSSLAPLLSRTSLFQAAKVYMAMVEADVGNHAHMRELDK
ncbi:hypothetical protein BDA96_06G087200 [Sorghum bicolor]|uniref:Uncharacterized protein n=2 Tax=Sorghum bicolor TaxID=4558 RepID=A0A921QRZ3_SORBI|nr:hypothetical protein BDA96_06G087200 [Sorghum bicolor]OQU81577.1 hypothetical protein SORBI_3006G079350 [Sorghum bicolor]